MGDDQASQQVDHQAKKVFLYILSGFFIFMLYGALLPFNITNAPPNGFIATLLSSSANEAQGQWINHVIFTLLLTFFISGYCHLSKSKTIWPTMFALIILFGFIIEYLQMYISSRGTSLVDIYANLSGMFFGSVLWLFYGKFTISAIRYIIKEKSLSLDFIKKIYLAFIIVIILFPFDFFINELQFKMAFMTKGLPLFEAKINDGVGLIAIISPILLLFPLGLFYRLSGPKNHQTLILKFAIFLLVLEILQFFEVSGQSSFLSFLLKFIGFYLGFFMGRFIDIKSSLSSLLKLRKVLLLTIPLFLWAALKLKGFSFGSMGSYAEITTIINNMSLLPFTYYLTVSSGDGLLSFIFNIAIYLPIGMYLAIYNLAKGNIDLRSISSLVIMAMIIAVLLETIVLIWGLKRPDVTNIITAMAALPVGYYLIVMANNATHKEVKNI